MELGAHHRRSEEVSTLELSLITLYSAVAIIFCSGCQQFNELTTPSELKQIDFQ